MPRTSLLCVFCMDDACTNNSLLFTHSKDFNTRIRPVTMLCTMGNHLRLCSIWILSFDRSSMGGIVCFDAQVSKSNKPTMTQLTTARFTQASVVGNLCQHILRILFYRPGRYCVITTEDSGVCLEAIAGAFVVQAGRRISGFYLQVLHHHCTSKYENNTGNVLILRETFFCPPECHMTKVIYHNGSCLPATVAFSVQCVTVDEWICRGSQ